MNSVKVKIGHISIEIRDMKKIKSFYESLFEIIGFKKIMEGEDYFGYSNGDLAIFAGKSDSVRVSKQAPSGQEFVIAEHLAFFLDTQDEVNFVSDALRKTGFEPMFPPELHTEFTRGYYAVTFCDPENNVLEFYTHDPL